VAKNRSSRSPIRSRITPTNQRNASVANGISESPVRRTSRRGEDVSQSAESAGSCGIATWIASSDVNASAEKTIPA
jgi:hypothetical protein